MPRIIMNRGFIARWTRMPHSTGRLSASVSSHHSLSSAAFITNIAESDFRHAQVYPEAKAEAVRAILAKHIIAAAMHGERDHARLRDGALLVLAQSNLWTVPDP